jgi:hypothetical protein
MNKNIILTTILTYFTSLLGGSKRAGPLKTYPVDSSVSENAIYCH